LGSLHQMLVRPVYTRKALPGSYCTGTPTGMYHGK
jgi:hypothetical protein